jgi:hypothetical protein
MPLPKRERLLKKFFEQLQFIQRSCEIYDKGFEDEAIRIATSLRVIFHNTGASISLIHRLKFTGKKMLSSSKGYGDIRDYLSWVIKLNSPEPVKTIPIKGDQFREISIDEWWNKENVTFHKNKRYPRRKVILNAVNKDGGAHIDELDEFYEALSMGLEGLSITGDLTYDGDSPFQQGVKQSSKNNHLALIRQFAHEFLVSVNHFSWLK